MGDVSKKVGDLSFQVGDLSFQVGDLSFQVDNLSFQVGDLSPKGRVGASRLDPVLSRQSVLPNGLKSDFLPKTGANRLSPM
ncbi:MAG: hypothetical protein LBI18_14385 [Planctomycetaceae bacterium]|nr:hypothetical protein [Planctomycetaceae bacterium]